MVYIVEETKTKFGNQKKRNSDRKDRIIVIRIEKIVPFFSNSSNPMHGSHG